MRSVRLATLDDASDVAAIYAPVVRDTAISFEIEPPDFEEVARRIAATLPARPWLVAEEDSRVVGYAYAGSHRRRAAYRWSVEPSVYVAADARGHGVGRTLYAALLAVLRRQGFANAYAGIALPNEPSLGLHRAFGFGEIGVYRQVGYKHGRWHDVWWGALDLAPDRGWAAPAAALDRRPQGERRASGGVGSGDVDCWAVLSGCALDEGRYALPVFSGAASVAFCYTKKDRLCRS